MKMKFVVIKNNMSWEFEDYNEAARFIEGSGWTVQDMTAYRRQETDIQLVFVK